MFKAHKVAVNVAAALAMGYAGMSTAAPTAPAVIADAMLRVDQFTILKGFGGGTSIKDGTSFTNCLSTIPGSCVGGEELVISQLNATSVINGNMSGQPSYNNTYPVGNVIAFPISHSNSTNGSYQSLQDINNSNLPAGAGMSASTGSYVLYTPIGAQPTATYSAGAADASGNSLVEGSNNKTHAQTSINNYGNRQGDAGSNLGLTVTVAFTTTTTTDFEFNFKAESYLRAALGQLTNAAQASNDWTLTLVNDNGTATKADDSVVQWNPGAGPLGLICAGAKVALCNEVSAPFSLDDTVSAQSLPLGHDTNPSMASSGEGVFELDVRLLAGTWQLSLIHQSNTSGSINQIPEPGTMALLGLGLLGLGFGVRRRTIA